MGKVEDILQSAPKYFRTTPARGGSPRVDRTGGFNSAGVIYGASVITKGEALGHDLWVDDFFLDQVVEFGNRPNKGAKSRFTHPSLSSDGMGRFLGRVTNFRREGDQAIGDLHFSRAAHKTPEGDLADYVMDLAEEDPEAFGISIAFDEDAEAMSEFYAEHQGLSPDPENKKGLVHARLASLRAADVVDDPAANPDGLFYREQEIAKEATAMASYCLGLSDRSPGAVALGLDVDRVKGFVARFLSENNLEVVEREDMSPTDYKDGKGKEEAQVPEAQAPEVEEKETSEVEESTADQDTQGEGTTAETPAADDTSTELSQGQKFLDAFGDRGGVWFAQGKSFEEAQALFCRELSEENERLKQQLQGQTAALGERDPIDFEDGDQKPGKGQGFASKIRIK